MGLERYLKAAKEAAQTAGRFLRESMDTAREIVFKGSVDLVTNLDNQSQDMIFKYLSASFPDHDFLAEEGLSEKRGAEFRWIIDPLDGTTNYTHKFPVFTVSIALEREREIVLGVVFDPMREEMFTALKGGGAFLNERKVRVSSVDDLDKSLVATGFPYDIRVSEVNNINHFNNFATRVQAIRRCGSAAMDLCYVACGRFDGFWELKLQPWDMAAGTLIVEEAAGQISDFKGKVFSFDSAEILASNGLIHGQMIDVLQLKK
ncbi:MAG: inositol monophosphatase [Candidatus Aminicenantes bacterium]|nr:MAG: inositol monophosphatase [Candidatus Aminicenantes bacterium]